MDVQTRRVVSEWRRWSDGESVPAQGFGKRASSAENVRARPRLAWRDGCLPAPRGGRRAWFVPETCLLGTSQDDCLVAALRRWTPNTSLSLRRLLLAEHRTGYWL